MNKIVHESFFFSNYIFFLDDVMNLFSTCAIITLTKNQKSTNYNNLDARVLDNRNFHKNMKEQWSMKIGQDTAWELTYSSMLFFLSDH